MDYKLEDLLLKTAGQLDEKEREFIKTNEDKLSEDDKVAYADFLTPPEEEPVAPVEPVTPEEPEAPAEPAPFSFKSEDEAREFVRKQTEENEKQKAEAIAKATTPAEKKYVEDNWKPDNWNHGIKTAAEAAVALMEEKQKAKEKQVEEHNAKVEADWQALRKEHKLEDISTETGLKVHNAIVDIGVKYGQKTFQSAYDLYMSLPKDKGGGYEIPASDAGAILAQQKASKVAEAKRVAGKIGDQNPGAGSVKGSSSLKPISYEDFHGKSQAKLLKEALEH